MGAIVESRHSLSSHRVLRLIQKLCKALAEEGVVYCHWKSNAALDRSARGDNDLDLLVSRGSMRLFTNILGRFGFKDVRASPEQEFPGVVSYYGYDSEADSFVHVHAHYQLVLGHDMTKNYCLPIDKPFLETAIQENLFKIAAPKFELIVFVIRMVLKHSTWDAILGRQGSLSTTERQELEYLQARVNETQMYDILKQHLPYVDATFFHNCIQSLRPDCPMWRRIKVGQQLQRRLKAQSRRSLISDVCLKLWRRGISVIRRRICGHSPRKRMASGGAIIALVGGDGAGKSTAADELYVWLSNEFHTIKLHMGKPAPSWTSFVARGAWNILNQRRAVRSRADAKSSVLQSYPSLMQHVLVARDRYRAYVKARRFVTNGGFVICDRYPLSQVKGMDGPASRGMMNIGQTTHLRKFLMQTAERYYDSIMQPELLIALIVNPEIAVLRKSDENPAYVRARSQEIWALDWRQTYAHVIDASRSRAEVGSDLKSLVWLEL